MASSEQKRSWPRRIGAFVVVFAIIAAAVAAASFALCPYGSRSQVLWTEFRNQDKLDTVCLGSSLGAQSFDPSVVDNALGTSSYNMCSPVQEVAESYLGLNEALEHHDIERVFYVVDFATFWTAYDMYPGRVYLNEKWKGDGFFERFADLAYALKDASWMFGEKSINWLFPWTEQRVGFSMVGDNIAMQMNGTPLIEAASVNATQGDYPWVYHGRGYGNYDGMCDFNADSQKLYTQLGMNDLDEANLQCLADICDRCAAEGIGFVAFVPPKPDFGIIDMRDRYDEYTCQLKSLVEEHGGSYYDFNLARPELFVSQESYFWDWEHLNAAGATVFSEALAKLLAARDAGANVDGLFMTYQEKLASIDAISIVVLEDELTAFGIKLSAHCLAGENVKPEYQFLAAGADGAFEVVQDYSPSSECLFAPDGHGAYTVRVNARQQGSGVEFEKRTQHQVTA